MDRLVASCLSKEPNNNGTHCCQSTVPWPGQSLVYLEIGVTLGIVRVVPGEKQKTSLFGKWTSLTRSWMLSSACCDQKTRPGHSRGIQVRESREHTYEQWHPLPDTTRTG